MSIETHCDPQVGDVFVCANPVEVDESGGWLLRLWHRVSSVIRPRNIYCELEYRCVVDLSPHSVYYLHEDDDRLHAAWLSEWMDWVEQAHMIANMGAPLPADIVKYHTGSSDVPFDLQALFGVDKSQSL